MSPLLDPLLTVVALANLALLSTSRLAWSIRLVAAQGIVLSLLPLVSGMAGEFRGYGLAGVTILVKGALIPWLLTVAMKRAQVQREPRAYVPLFVSFGFGLSAIGAAVWLGSRLHVPGGGAASTALPVAFLTLATGLFIIVTRRTALSQVIGYLILENGIYAFGVVMVGHVPALVELGVLLDVIAGVFIMGIAIFHIQEEFEHVDVGELTDLRG